MITRFVTLLLFAFALPAFGQHVTYDIAFPYAQRHEAEITVTFADIPSSAPLAVRMSRTSPGRYALHEFAKNVYNVRATNAAGEPLTITRPDLHQWDIHDHGGTVRLSYTLFGDHADGTYTGIDLTHAHLNMPATFMWARQMQDAPIRISFRPYMPGAHVATQLAPTDDPFVFTAPNLAYFLDSPTEISRHAWRTWDIKEGRKTYTIRMAVHHEGTDAEVDAFVEMAKKVVDEQIAVYGSLPDYEYGTYTFIACYLPYVDGDGMEHRNSTILTSTRPLATRALRNLGTVSHEYFHQWNVERLRPQSLEPFDFEAANMSDALWFAEGFTSYYTGLMIRRAGVTDDADYAQSLSGTVNTVINAPGRQFFSAVEMSMQAPFVDAATSVDPQNKHNTFISYYTWGNGIGLALDLTLRGQYDTSLDAYMRTLWEQFGQPETPYTLDDLKTVLGDLTGDPAFAQDFFARYIEGHEAADYEALLAQAGFALRKARAQEMWLGADLEQRDTLVVVAEAPPMGSPLYEAGIGKGDILIQMGRLMIRDVAHVEAFMTLSDVGNRAPVVYEARGEKRKTQLIFTEDPRLEVIPYEAIGKQVTEAMQQFRAEWLGSKAKR